MKGNIISRQEVRAPIRAVVLEPLAGPPPAQSVGRNRAIATVGKATADASARHVSQVAVEANKTTTWDEHAGGMVYHQSESGMPAGLPGGKPHVDRPPDHPRQLAFPFVYLESG